MSLTYDQRSELRYAFEEAYVEPERRRACRIRHKVVARLAPWNGSRPRGHAIQVTMDDGTFGIGLEAMEIIDSSQFNSNPFAVVAGLSRKAMRLTTRRTKILFLVFGIFGICVSAFLT